MTTRTFTYAPTADMLAEAFEDGTPCHWTVYAADGSPIGAVAAGLSAREWLPTGPTPGDHGPMFGDLRDAASWVAERAGTSSCGARRLGWTEGPAFGRRRLPCVLPEDHHGRHANAFGDTWGDHDVPDNPHAEAAREASRHVSANTGMNDTHRQESDSMGTTSRTDTTRTAAALTAILADPDAPARVQRLKDADALFELLDAALRNGGDVPEGWQVETNAPVAAHVYVTSAYDTLSEALRERGNARVARAALASAKAWWGALDSAMRVGSPLPEPWEL